MNFQVVSWLPDCLTVWMAIRLVGEPDGWLIGWPTISRLYGQDESMSGMQPARLTCLYVRDGEILHWVMVATNRTVGMRMSMFLCFISSYGVREQNEVGMQLQTHIHSSAHRLLKVWLCAFCWFLAKPKKPLDLSFDPVYHFPATDSHPIGGMCVCVCSPASIQIVGVWPKWRDFIAGQLTCKSLGCQSNWYVHVRIHARLVADCDIYDSWTAG